MKKVKVFVYKQGELVIFGLENFTSVFQKPGGNLNFEKNAIFLEFFWFYSMFQDISSKKSQTDRKILRINEVNS